MPHSADGYEGGRFEGNQFVFEVRLLNHITLHHLEVLLTFHTIIRTQARSSLS